MARTVTLDDVAEKVGVSARTVSRVVNDEPGFSEATRNKVQAAIDELGYRPNFAARGLVTRKSHTIGCVVTDISNPFFPRIVQSMHRTARRRGYTLFLCNTEDDEQEQRALLDSLLSYGSDGAIVFPAPTGFESITKSAEEGLSLVVMDSQLRHPDVANVNIDLEGGAAAAVDHLVAIGRRHIGMVANSHSPKDRRWRERGFRSALRRHGLDHSRGRTVRVEPYTQDGYRAAVELIETFPELDGIFAYNDAMAVGVLSACADHDKRVPDDIAVVGFDGIELGEYVTPKLTSMWVDRDLLGERAVDTLLDMIETGQMPARPVVVPTSLVARESA